MREDETGMFMQLLWGADPGEFPITPLSINRRLHRVARDARIDRRVTIRTLQTAGRRLMRVELWNLQKVDAAGS